ncbi:hypothetical protein VTK73DRAFT_4031 [Phialemonium thermophilum]|uniref:FAD-binding PCMH-type domain-containing protein n=1 Tax=Phialemonium thermophilum TaxID=223376 RepID=A0ABR3WWD0_9PEZI
MRISSLPAVDEHLRKQEQSPTLRLVLRATTICLPGDPCWPAPAEWDRLNSSVGGRLIATVPLGKPCHDPDFNATECDIIKAQWQYPTIHMSDSASIMSPYFANHSCDPFTAPSTPCSMGNYVQYAVAAESASHVNATLSFARAHNLRLVVRNTGHDYLGRSTGAGALAVWMHRLKDVRLVDWDDGDDRVGSYAYHGKAVRVAAGAQGFQVLDALRGTGFVMVGGECPTVGPAGGYTQGGGHSALSSTFGLAADNVLEWEVLTADGQVRKASRTQNSDLYWALSGGGPGNYGVVLSMTARAHADAPIGSASLFFVAAANHDGDRFWAAIDAFHAALPAIVDAGCMVVYDITDELFQMAPLTAYNKTREDVADILSPLLHALDSLGVAYFATFNHSATYYDHYDQYFGPLPYGAITLGISQDSGRVGGRLVPRSTVLRNNKGLGQTARRIAEQRVLWVGVALNVKPFGGGSSNNSSASNASNGTIQSRHNRVRRASEHDQNAVLPAWREALVHVILTAPLSPDPAQLGTGSNASPADEAPAEEDVITDVVMPAIEAVTPGSGAYMNEADFRQRNFQQAFFGAKYGRLLAIKRRYDPEGFFYATAGVGSEAWELDNDGRLCRAQTPE